MNARDFLIFLAGGISFAFCFSLPQLFREVYGNSSLYDKIMSSGAKCNLCGQYGAKGHDDDLGPVCAQCEVELSRVGAQLVKLSEKIQ